MKKRVSFLVLALLIAISGCGKSESSLNGQDSSEEINANGTGEDGEQTKTGAGDAADKEADTADAKQNADIHAATLSERNRIAREIHDNVGHMLTRSLLQVGALKVIARDDALDEPLTELQNTLNTAMTNVRTSVHDLHDNAIDLESTLWEIIDGVNTTKISLEYDVEGTLPNPIKYAFIAIVKEAVNNIQKHSNAKNAFIRVCMHPGLPALDY